MKTTFKYLLVLLCSFVSLCAMQAADYTSKIVVKRAYPSGNNPTLSVENKYGYIHIQEWDKNEVSFVVAITTTAKSQEEANALTGSVKVNFSQVGNEISAVTNFEGSCNRCSRSVDYQIMVPKNIHYKLRNKYGNISLNNSKGNVIIDLMYGNLKTLNLSGNENSIMVKYGSIDITELMGKANRVSTSYGSKVKINTSNQLDMEINYSQLTLGNVGRLNIQSKYNNVVSIQSVKELNFQSKYENYKIGTVDRMKGEASHTDIKINRLNRSIDLPKLSYGDLDIEWVASGFEHILAKGSYADFELKLDPKASCQIDLSGKYSDFSVEAAKFNSTTRNDNILQGSIGSGNSSIKIYSSYGDIEIK